MGTPITAEQHNATRRAVKAKQRANKGKSGRAVSGPPIKSGSLIQEATRDRVRHERILALRAANEKRLLDAVDAKGMLILSRPKWDEDAYFGDYSDYEYGVKRFHIDVADVKRAAKASPRRYHWHELDNGDFCIALPKRA